MGVADWDVNLPAHVIINGKSKKTRNRWIDRFLDMGVDVNVTVNYDKGEIKQYVLEAVKPTDEINH